MGTTFLLSRGLFPLKEKEKEEEEEVIGMTYLQRNMCTKEKGKSENATKCSTKKYQ